jgi:hypothetical protein
MLKVVAPQAVRVTFVMEKKGKATAQWYNSRLFNPGLRVRVSQGVEMGEKLAKKMK